MGLFDKAKELSAKAFDSAKTVSNTVMEKTGISERLHMANINSLAFHTEEELRQSYLAGAAVGTEAAKVVANFMTKKLGKTITETIGVSLPSLEQYMKKYFDGQIDKVLTEEEIEENIQKIFQDRKDAQVELLEIWKSSSKDEERAMYERYKGTQLWIKE